MSSWDKKSWDMLEVREMARRDLADFIPPNLYNTNKVTISEIDCKIGKKLNLSSEPEHINMTTRQRRAASVLWKLGLCGFAAWKIQHTEEEGLRESMKERLAVLEADLPHFIKSYVECISEEERKLLSIFTVNDTGQQDNLPDSARTSLLKIVLGIAVKKYKYDPEAKKSAVPGVIKRDLEIVGIKISEETVLAYLREAATRIPFKGA
ncbi:hypothetical protein SAMN05216403_1419 [Nitrosospira multiformis ATCC 25196]|uniref:Uncharacterized protein n=1 Tax=Nitrosospira multiformis (strain ATCC 25196 / NCIMB 11849 / C 71) TaxID=323848 RepID=Q2YCZ9_NITMU|nr:hypothetical protein [Nitrosospira multiformis]ABB73372.1 hypothetical protein Nmul_A0063 [Nitrosospira multiformis ATCC 25196]SEG17203.1 hypothetical protein SAMN05216403_1419 [Nitrosospira multiformis ATCC 25196]